MVKKLFSVIIAATMLFCIPVFAANPTTESTITIDKNLKVINATLTSVAGPGLTYTYAIAPETPSATNGGTSITDSTGTAGNVKAGPNGGVTLSSNTVSWPADTAVTASPSGADNVKSFTATADISKFEGPGIYRYKITETATPANPATIGVTDSDPAEVRYLDVYVENKPTQKAEGSTYQIAGIVMHNGDLTSGKKTFDDSTFETINITLKNIVSGTMGDREHLFPFEGTITDNGRFFYAQKSESPSADDSFKVTNGSVKTSLANEEMYYINGLSTVARIQYKETNDTPDTYEVNYTNGTTSNVAPTNEKAMAAVDAMDIVFENKLDSASLTGIDLRYGAYIGIILFGLALIIINRKTK